MLLYIDIIQIFLYILAMLKKWFFISYLSLIKN
jgi:hypothetical protein